MAAGKHKIPRIGSGCLSLPSLLPPGPSRAVPNTAARSKNLQPCDLDIATVEKRLRESLRHSQGFEQSVASLVSQWRQLQSDSRFRAVESGSEFRAQAIGRGSTCGSPSIFLPQ